MNFKDVTDRLSAEQKKRLRDARTQEELDGLFTGEGMTLTDDQLDGVAGGGCFRPESDAPEVPEIKTTGICENCKNPVPQDKVMCPYCDSPIPGRLISGLSAPYTPPPVL